MVVANNELLDGEVGDQSSSANNSPNNHHQQQHVNHLNVDHNNIEDGID